MHEGILCQNFDCLSCSVWFGRLVRSPQLKGIVLLLRCVHEKVYYVPWVMEQIVQAVPRCPHGLAGNSVPLIALVHMAWVIAPVRPGVSLLLRRAKTMTIGLLKTDARGGNAAEIMAGRRTQFGSGVVVRTP